jgi:hypothetical protein
LFFGPQGPLYDGQGGYGNRIATFTDCPDGPQCRKARQAGVRAALEMEQAGGNYEAQRLAAEATFLANLRDKAPPQGQRPTALAFPTFAVTLPLINELAARGRRDAETAARLHELLLEAEIGIRGLRPNR